MRVIKDPAAMQRIALAAKRVGQKIGFVPTMGYLHAGHLGLVHAARKRIGAEGLIVVSIYVNPTQFAPTEDLSKYPRDFAGDSKQCRAAGVDVIFAPSDLYPDQAAEPYSTYVVEEVLSQGMEGASRPTHFRGVTTVVAKLFNCVLPDLTVFGAKDWQQAAVVGRMIKDLNFPIQIIVAPTHREADGLAMSSRNKYLSADERSQATILWRVYQRARTVVKAARRSVPSAGLKLELGELIATQSAARLDYLEFFDPVTLRPTSSVQAGTQLALAVFLGRTRLIDNGRI